MTDKKNFEQWLDESPNQRYGYVVWEAWQAACASRQKEIDALEAQLREQHQNQLELIEQLAVLEKQIRLYSLEKYEKSLVEPEEVYSPHTMVTG